MSKPYIHALSSAKQFGGVPEDYLEIHNLMDKSKGTIADSRHRALTHNAWFVSEILERIFGVAISISQCKICGKTGNPKIAFENADFHKDGIHPDHIFVPKKVSVRDIGEQHVLEDYNMRFIPSAQDFLEGIPIQEWMIAGKGKLPPSAKLLERTKNRKIINLD